MWPYDFFNSYSSLINEFGEEVEKTNVKKIEAKRKKVFLAKWFEDPNKDKEKNLRKLIESIDININICTEKDSDKISDKLRYWLKMEISKDIQNKKGNINIGIFALIIESSLVILDITPMNKKELLEGRDDKPHFNPNVLAELGLALAWKMSEQVIILWDKDLLLEKYPLPFDIRGYFVAKVDFNDLENKEFNLKEHIVEHLKAINFRKQILIKNIKSKLDRDSLSLLVHNQGLIFSQQYSGNSFYYDRELGTIRHLLNLGLFRTEKYPDLTFGYYLTDLGRYFLKNTYREGIVKLYPKIFAEFIRVSFWLRNSKKDHLDRKNFIKEQKGFHAEYRIKWKDSDNILRKLLKAKGIKDADNVFDMFNNYTNNKSFEHVMKEIIYPWKQKIDKLKYKNKAGNR
jgi:hypothetical protein